MRKIISEEIGPLSSAMFVMRPENFELRLTMAVRASAPRSSTVGLHCRMERIAGYGANVTYPPPFAAKMGMDKLWAAFEQVLRERGLPVVREGVDEETREDLRA